MNVKLFFAWYDFWVGWFYDRKKRTLYICRIPQKSPLAVTGD